MLEIRRVGPKIGVEVRGIDVKTMDDDDFAKIYQAWLDCNIMCVRGQELTIPDFIRYSERFGPVTPHPSKSTRHPEYPKITMLGINKYDRRGQIARRDLSPRRRGLAHRRGLQPGAVQGDAALRAGGAEPRRQHAVRERLCRL